jgi:hypothetical protein
LASKYAELAALGNDTNSRETPPLCGSDLALAVWRSPNRKLGLACRFLAETR